MGAVMNVGLALNGGCEPPPPIDIPGDNDPDPMMPDDPMDDPDPMPDPPSAEPIVLRGEVLFGDVDFPVSMAFLPDGRMFYSEKNTGLVRVVKDGVLLEDPVLSVPVNHAAERGTLGITPHPDFESNGYLYLFYIRSASGEVTSDPEDILGARLVRFTIDGDRASGDEEVILEWPLTRPDTFHLGGNIRFGSDGKLYVTRGDLAISANAQDLSNVNGKFLRYNDDGTIPADNPFGPDNPIFALGVRNSFDFAIDPLTGALFATENGTIQHDELNRIDAGGNYGWPDVEGFADDAPGDPIGETLYVPATGTYFDPLLEEPDPPAVALTGIDIAPNDLYGEGTAGDLFYGEFNTAMVWRVTLDETRSAVVERTLFAMELYGGITDVAFDPDGVMYVSVSDKIYQVLPAEDEDDEEAVQMESPVNSP